jgi:hypothetical protein
MNMTSKHHHYCQGILHLSKASTLLTLILQEATAYSLIDVDNVDADTVDMHLRLSITSSSEILSQSHTDSTWKKCRYPIGSSWHLQNSPFNQSITGLSWTADQDNVTDVDLRISLNSTEMCMHLVCCANGMS